MLLFAVMIGLHLSPVPYTVELTYVIGSRCSPVPRSAEVIFVCGSRWSPRQCSFGGFTDVLGDSCSSVKTLVLNG